MLTCLLDCYARAYPILKALGYRVADIDDSWVTLEGPAGQIGITICSWTQRDDTTFAYTAEVSWHTESWDNSATKKQHIAWHALQHALPAELNVRDCPRCPHNSRSTVINC